MVEDYKVDRIESLEYYTSARLEIVEEQKLIAGGEVFGHGLYYSGGCKVGTIYVRAIDNDRNLSLDSFLCYKIPHEIDRRKNEATVGRNH